MGAVSTSEWSLDLVSSPWCSFSEFPGAHIICYASRKTILPLSAPTPSLPSRVPLGLEVWSFPPNRRTSGLNLTTIFQSQCFVLLKRGRIALLPRSCIAVPWDSHRTLCLYTEPLQMLFQHLRLDQCLWHNWTACKASSTAKSVSLELPSWPLFTSISLYSIFALHPASLLQLTWCDTSNTWKSPPSPSLAPCETLHYLTSSFQEVGRKKWEDMCTIKS